MTWSPPNSKNFVALHSRMALDSLILGTATFSDFCECKPCFFQSRSPGTCFCSQVTACCPKSGDTTHTTNSPFLRALRRVSLLLPMLTPTSGGEKLRGKTQE